MKLLTTDRSNNPNKYQLPPLKWFQATSIDRTLEIGFTNSASIHIVFPCDHWAIKFFLTEISQPTRNFWCTSPTNARNGSYRFVAYPSTVKNLIRDMILKTMVLFCFRFVGKNFIMPIMLPQARTPATAPFELMRKKIFIQIKFMVFVMQMVNYLENVALLLLLCIKISLINNLFSIIFILKIQKTVTRCTVF